MEDTALFCMALCGAFQETFSKILEFEIWIFFVFCILNFVFAIPLIPPLTLRQEKAPGPCGEGRMRRRS